MQHICVVGLLKHASEDLSRCAIFSLLQLVSSFKKDRAILDLVYLTDEQNFVVEPQVHRIVAKVDDSGRPKLWRTIL